MKLTIKNLSFSYETNLVLDQINVVFPQGKVVALIAENGSGKTTLLKCLAGINSCRGEIWLDQEKISGGQKEKTSKKTSCEIAYVPQEIEQCDLSVFDFVLLGRLPYFSIVPTEKDLHMVELALDKLKIQHLSFKKLTEISGGEKQKVALAKAMVQNPKIFLLDEVTSALDIKNQEETLSWISKVCHEESLLSLCTIHDINLAMRYADLFLILKNHQILFYGPKEEITSTLLQQTYGISFEKIETSKQIIFIPKGGWMNEKN
jgi:iron complex transport system ATP-binding protein